MARITHVSNSINWIGHRGLSLHKYPENLINSLEMAFQAGFDAETDFQPTRDKVLILYHDDFIPGTNDTELNGGGFVHLDESNKKPVSECTLAELHSRTRFDALKHERLLSKDAGRKVNLDVPSNPKIATLEELIVLMKKYPDRKVHLEIKRADEKKKYDDGLEETFVGMLNDAGISDQVIVISFNEDSLKKTRTASSKIVLGADVWGKQADDISEAKRMQEQIGIKFWNPSFSDPGSQTRITTQELVAAIKALGLDLAPWPWGETIESEAIQTDRMKSFGLTNIMINRGTAVLA